MLHAALLRDAAKADPRPAEATEAATADHHARAVGAVKSARNEACRSTHPPTDPSIRRSIGLLLSQNAPACCTVRAFTRIGGGATGRCTGRKCPSHRLGSLHSLEGLSTLTTQSAQNGCRRTQRLASRWPSHTERWVPRPIDNTEWRDGSLDNQRIDNTSQ